VNVGGRTINVGQQSINVRGVGLIGKTDDIEKVVLGTSPDGVPVLVRDVAKVSVGSLPRLGKAGRDGQEDVVTGIVIMNRTLQTNEVLDRVKAEVDKMNRDGTLPPGVQAVPFYDRGSLIAVTTHTVFHNLIFGCALVFLIQWVFLGDLRSAIMVGLNIPFALLFSISILYMMGESANLLSVGAVDFGIIVDSCVILVENIFRNLQMKEADQGELLVGQKVYRRPDEAPPGWTHRVQMILASALQVDKAILFSTLITLAAFIPLFTMQGVEGQIFSPMARTYAYALGGALLGTFTVTPVLSTIMFPKHVEEVETIVVRALRGVYEPVLLWTLRHRMVMIVVGVSFLAGVAGLIPKLGGEFLPTLEEGNLWIRATMPQTISLEAGMPYVNRIREILKSRPEVITVVSQHGRPDDGSDAAGFNNAEFFAPLKPQEEWPKGMTKDQIIKELGDQFAKEFTGINFNFSQYIQDNIEEGLSGVKGANSVKIIGRDLPTLERLGSEVKSVMADIKGVTDLDIFRILGQPNLNITIDREKAARYGLNSGDVNAVVQAALGGTQATTVLEEDRQFALVVRLAAEYRDTLERTKYTKVGFSTSTGGVSYVPLSDLAQISLDTGASYIYHERNERFIPVKFSVRDRDLESTVAEAQAEIAKRVKLPVGYRIQWAGEFESLQQAKARLAIIVPVSLGVILVLLYGLFGSIRDCFLTLVGIPFAAAGGIIALLASGLAFSISAAIGFVSLLGISVMNGILVLTYYHETMLNSRLTPTEGMYHAASQRMRPMLMTALSACIGLLPAAISRGIGSQVQRPLATVVVGGLLIGPLMLLVVVPPLCMVFLDKPHLHGKGSGPAAPPAPPAPPAPGHE
jgi:cobalt-zinc-cadmium resistance protein CzcA